MKNDQDTATRYRQCADHARAMADRTMDSDVVYLLTSIADGYEQMAEIEEGISPRLSGSDRDRPAKKTSGTEEADQAH